MFLSFAWGCVFEMLTPPNNSAWTIGFANHMPPFARPPGDVPSDFCESAHELRATMRLSRQLVSMNPPNRSQHNKQYPLGRITMVLKRLLGLITSAATLRSKLSPEQALRDAKYALGERMVNAGIDDGHLGEQIALVDTRIRAAQNRAEPTDALLGERRMLVLRLADAALEVDAPLPGAQPEYEKARACETAFEAARPTADLPPFQVMQPYKLIRGAKTTSRA
jgi:hypothetical protein